MNRFATLAAAMAGIVCCLPALGGDWPQILGPNRNGAASDEPLPDQFPDQGPRRIWSVPVGEGFAGPAVVAGRVVVFHRIGDQERVEARDAGSGEVIWKADYPANYRGGVNPDNGPRCVPLIHGNRVYLYGAAGDLHCVALDNGAKIWSRDTSGDFGAIEGYFGAGSSPIVCGNRLLVNVGGRKGGLVAFHLETGDTVWTATEEQASYASPTQYQRDGQPCAIFVTRYTALGISPADGSVLFSFPFGKRGPTVNAATPLVWDNRLFVSASYGIGARLSSLDQPDQAIWASDEILSSQYSTPVYFDGHLCGTHGREDIGIAELRCVRVQDGQVTWREANFGVSHQILAGDRLLILSVDGRLVLAKADADRFQQLDQATVSTAVTRALPALSEGRFYLRDNQDNQGTLACWQLVSP